MYTLLFTRAHFIFFTLIYFLKHANWIYQEFNLQILPCISFFFSKFCFFLFDSDSTFSGWSLHIYRRYACFYSHHFPINPHFVLCYVLYPIFRMVYICNDICSINGFNILIITTCITIMIYFNAK